MKFSPASISLTFFAAVVTGLIGVGFCAAPLSVLPYMIADHGLVSFVPLLDIVVTSAGLAVVVLSIGLGLRKQWAHTSLVRAMLALTIIFALNLGRKLVQEGRTSADHVMDLTFGSCVLALMGLVILFLLNRHILEDLRPRPDRPDL